MGIEAYVSDCGCSDDHAERDERALETCALSGCCRHRDCGEERRKVCRAAQNFDTSCMRIERERMPAWSRNRERSKRSTPDFGSVRRKDMSDNRWKWDRLKRGEQRQPDGEPKQ
jgi:hypothetical protein